MPGDTVLGLSHTRQQGLRIRDSLALMNKTHEVCSFQNGFSNKNRTGMRVCDAIFNHRREEVGAGDGRTAETVPCQGTPRGGHIALRLLWGWTGDLLGWLGRGQRRTEDTSALEVPLVLTVQFTRRPQWGDSGRWREQDGGTGWESQILFTDFFFERVSCSPGWPPTGYIVKDDLELLLSPPQSAG